MKKYLFLLALATSTPALAADPLDLSWNRNPEDTKSGVLDCTINPLCFGYTIYFGTSKTTVSKEIGKTAGIAYKIDTNLLVVNPDKLACFGIKAFNRGGTSVLSDTVCTNLTNTLVKPTAPIGLKLELSTSL